jgi:hypothetical protein
VIIKPSAGVKAQATTTGAGVNATPTAADTIAAGAATRTGTDASGQTATVGDAGATHQAVGSVVDVAPAQSAAGPAAISTQIAAAAQTDVGVVPSASNVPATAVSAVTAAAQATTGTQLTIAPTADSTPTADAAPAASLATFVGHTTRRPGTSSPTFGYGSGSSDAETSTATPGHSPVAAAASAGSSSGTADGSTSSGQSDAFAAGLDAARSARLDAAAPADPSMLAASGAVAAPSTRVAATEATAVVSQAVDLADAANRLMNQVVGTIHTYQTSAGPALETRISDPVLGDVRVIASGRAGEIVQAQLVVRDRVSVEAISAAVTRMRSTGDGLTGVSVSVRTEGGSTSMGGRAGSNAFEAAGWTAGGEYGTASGSGANGGHGQGSGNGEQATAAGGNGGGSQPGSGDSPRGPHRSVPATRPESTTTTRPLPRTPLRGGSSLDIRA